MDIDKDKNAGSNFDDGNNIGAGISNDTDVASIDKNKNANNSSSDSSNINTAEVNNDKNVGINSDASTTDINKIKKISDRFGNAIADRVNKNVEKQLKISKFKVFIVIINYKKYHLSKKILAFYRPFL